MIASLLRCSLRRGPGTRRRGQAAFEFILILPFFILFILLTVDLGMLMYEYVSVANASREGARYGAVRCGGSCTASLIKQRVLARSGGILSNTGEVTVYWCEREAPSGATPTRGDSIVVRVDHTYNLLFFTAASIQVQSMTDMRMEADDTTSTVPLGGAC